MNGSRILVVEGAPPSVSVPFRSLTDGDDKQSGFDVRIIDPTQEVLWDAAVVGHPQGSIFHTAAWAAVLKECYRHEPCYLLFTRSGSPAALVPIMEVASQLTGRRGVALPFSDVCSPLFLEGATMSSISEHLVSLSRDRGWKYLEVRGNGEGLPGAESQPAFYGHRLSLCGSAEDLRTRFSSAVRRNLRKAERSGLTMRIARSKEAVVQYYQLHVRTRRRHGAPPQPFVFFDSIFRNLIEPGMGFVSLASRDGCPVAGAVYLTHGENAVYKFGASDERLQGYRANNLVMWEAIKHLCESGKKNLHFGRTSPYSNGLRQFKRSWGAQEELLRYARLDPTSGVWANLSPDSKSIVQFLFRRLPSAVNKWVGSVLYPHLD